MRPASSRGRIGSVRGTAAKRFSITSGAPGSRMLTGIEMRTCGTRRPELVSMTRPKAPATSAISTSLTVAPNFALSRFTSSSGSGRVQPTRFRPPTGGPCSACRSGRHSARSSSTTGESSEASTLCVSRAAGPGAGRTCAGPASSSSISEKMMGTIAMPSAIAWCSRTTNALCPPS